MADSKVEESKILQPISLNTITGEIQGELLNEEYKLSCLLCDEEFPATENGSKNPLLAHLLSVHQLVISEVENIANFPNYIKYWKKKFTEKTDLSEYCVIINTNTKPVDKAPQEKYFLLTSFLPEDKTLRDKLNTQKLTEILDEQQMERFDQKFSRRCLFCKVMFHGNRAGIFQHMAKDHAFNVGNPDNIVHAAEFIDLIKSKLDRFTCLFCEKSFKDWNILKSHMRKKSHKSINPANKEYDKFYVINYLEPGKDWKEVQLEPEYEKETETSDKEEDTEKEWEIWTEEGKETSLCLFCSKTDSDVYSILDHMKKDHHFDLHSLKESMDLTFYHQVKIVNYIRKQVYLCKCPRCLEGFKDKEGLNLHLTKEGHYGLPTEKSVWDQPGYFFSTFDDDSLLCFLEDDDEDEEVEEEDENRNIKPVTKNENDVSPVVLE